MISKITNSRHNECCRIKAGGQDRGSMYSIYSIYSMYCTYWKHASLKLNELDRDNTKGVGA